MIAHRLLTASGIIFLLSACNKVIDQPSTYTSQAETIIEYGQRCAELIGEIPPFNCNDGTIVPITVNGKTPATYTHQMQCDRPSMLPYGEDTFGQCTPYSKILDLSQGAVQISAFCRREYLRTPDSPLYDEIDIILHSVSTGDTCWFHTENTSGPEGGISGHRVPPPNEVNPPAGHTAAKDFWWTPTDTAKKACGNCHDADPFMYSPYIGQVWDKVPTDPWGYYNNHIGPNFSRWPKSSTITTPNNTCTGCHRIGNLDSCTKNIISSAAGREPILGGNQNAQSYPLNHWMPINNFHSQAFWDNNYQDSVDKLLACCEDPSQSFCTLTEIEGRD